MLSESFYIFSFSSLKFSSKVVFSRSSTRSIHIYALSSQNFVHSFSIFLMLSTSIIFFLSHPILSSSGVLNILFNCRSSILVKNPLMTLLILNTCYSMVSYTTNGTYRISLHNFWTVTCVFCAIFSASSFTFWDLSVLSSTSFFSFITLSTFFATSHFSCRAISYSCCNLALSSVTLVNYLDAKSMWRLISCIIPTYKPCSTCIGICYASMFK